MLTKLELNICEAVYLCIHYETISPDIKNQLIKTVYDLKNKEAYLYLQWLLYRWTIIKPINQLLPRQHIFKHLIYYIMEIREHFIFCTLGIIINKIMTYLSHLIADLLNEHSSFLLEK